MKRINAFLDSDELEADVVQHNPSDLQIFIKNASFSWDESKPVLRNINLQIKRGQLVAIIGDNDFGKSSLILSILGEMRKVSGEINTRVLKQYCVYQLFPVFMTSWFQVTVAYASQCQSWLQHGTIRDNVLFGKDLH